jgi:hypothetical protein
MFQFGKQACVIKKEDLILQCDTCSALRFANYICIYSKLSRPVWCAELPTNLCAKSNWRYKLPFLISCQYPRNKRGIQLALPKGSNAEKSRYHESRVQTLYEHADWVLLSNERYEEWLQGTVFLFISCCQLWRCSASIHLFLTGHYIPVILCAGHSSSSVSRRRISDVILWLRHM